MFVQREFKLMGGKVDYQYVSSVNSKGLPDGYDRNKDYALNLSEWQLRRAVNLFKDVGCKWNETIS